MDSLLEKVKGVEKEAQDRIDKVERAAKKKLSDIKNSEADVIKSVREQANTRAEEIIKESLARAKREVNAIHQDREQAIKKVRENALKNREKAVKTLLDFFLSDFVEQGEAK